MTNEFEKTVAVDGRSTRLVVNPSGVVLVFDMEHPGKQGVRLELNAQEVIDLVVALRPYAQTFAEAKAS